MVIEIQGGQPIADKGMMLSFLEIISGTSHIAVDTESDPDTDWFLGFSVAHGELAMYFPVGHMEADVNVDDEVLESALYTIDKHDLRVFQHAGYDLMRFEKKLHKRFNGRFVCTMTWAHHINENLPSKSLDSLHKYFCNGKGKEMPELMKSIIKEMGWRYVPVQLMSIYCNQDAIAASELYTTLRPLYEKQFGPPFSEVE